MRDHTKLKAFQLADALVLRVSEATSGFPNHEQFGLTSQMSRAAVSIPSNIVEGCARESESEFLHFLSMDTDQLANWSTKFRLPIGLATSATAATGRCMPPAWRCQRS